MQTKGFKIGLESFYKVKDEVDELFKLHWEEIAVYKDKMKINPDWAFYQALYDSDSLGIYGVRDSEDSLVGYFIVIVRPHPHYMDHTIASNDLIYIHPDHRKGLLGYKLIKFAEKDLISKGVSVLVINTKTHQPFDPLLERLGFNLQERVYTKYLQGE